MALDPRTLIVACLLIAALLGIISLFFAWRRPETRGVGLWGASMLLLAVGLAGVASRGVVPPWVSTIAANTIIAAAIAFAVQSLRAMRGMPPVDSASWMIVLAMFVFLLLLPESQAQHRPRMIIISVALIGLFSRAAMVVRRDVPAECVRSFRFAETVYWTAVGVNAVRGAAVLFDPDEDLLSPGLTSVYTFLAYTGLVSVASLAVVWMQIELLQRDLVRLATHDTLTGVLNRRALLEEFERELSRAKRQSTELSVVIFDVDHFKRFNDQFGHPAGDRVLKAVVDTMRSSVRRHDRIGRYGGEEFAVLMPGAGHDTAMRVAERIRARIEKRGFAVGGKHAALTVSGGLGSYPANGGDWNALLTAADTALYSAKSGGRNRVLASSETHTKRARSVRARA